MSVKAALSIIALISAALTGPSQAGVVFNWVTVSDSGIPPNFPYSGLNTMSVTISDATYNAAQQGSIRFGEFTVGRAPNLLGVGQTAFSKSGDVNASVTVLDTTSGTAIVRTGVALSEANALCPRLVSSGTGSCAGVFGSSSAVTAITGPLPYILNWNNFRGQIQASDNSGFLTNYGFSLNGSVLTVTGRWTTGFQDSTFQTILGGQPGLERFFASNGQERVADITGFWQVDARTIPAPSPVPLPATSVLIALGFLIIRKRFC